MKNSRLFKRMAKSSGARALATLAAILLVAEPFAFALDQTVYRFPTGYSVSSVDMGGGNLLPYGSVFDFNSAKSALDSDAFSSIREGACVPEGTSYTFGSGMEGWSGTPVTDVVYSQTLAVGSGALKVALGKTNRSRAFTLEKKFFYDCGTPTAVSFAIKYQRGTWNIPGAQADNNFRVELVKPTSGTVPLIGTVATPIQITAEDLLTTGSLNSSWNVAADLTEVGTYTLRIAGNLRTSTSGGSRVEVIFDDINLSKASSYESFKTDVEYTLAATPYKSATGTYNLDLRARRAAGDTENTSVQVWNGSAWTTRYTVNSDTFTTYASYNLTDAEYNGGTVRVRFVDATPLSDLTQGGIDVEYLRVTVDQGVCVDQVADTLSDCGKCHNYGGDITRPWPLQGMHNKHAQSESATDCLWCHVNNGSDSAHRNGGQIELGGTKLYRLGGANPNGAPPTATYDTATGRCSNIACHKGLQTPAWTATYGLTQGAIDGVNVIARNCSRCHNNGTPGADTYTGPSGSYAPNLTDYNLDKAWPPTATDGGGHTSHDAAFTINAPSCVTNGSCHPNNLGQHTVVGDGNIEVKMAPAYASPNKVVKYYPATKTCANVACHGGQQTPAFNTASANPIDVATQCDKCHIAEQAGGWGLSAGNASQWNSAISGLHRGGPPTSEITHTGITANTCRDCHNLPVKHFREGGAGTNSNLHTTDMELLTAADFKALPAVTLGSGGTRPNWTTPTSCSIAAGTTGCHTESNTTYRNPATSWARKWTWDAFSATEADRCKNCHGTWGSFASGVSTPHAAKGGIGGVLHTNHSDNGKFCGTMCHATNDDGVNGYSHGVAPTATSKTIDININAGWVDNNPASTAANTTVGCGFCHASNDSTDPLAAGKHVFQETGWTHTSPQPNGPTPTCYNSGASASCHGNGTNEYWPNGSAYPDREGRHDEHMAKIAAKLVITLPGTDAEQKRMCQYCHPASPGAAGHADQVSPADVNAFNPIWDVANPPATTDSGSAYTAADGTCASIDCHNNQTTTAGTYGWRDAGPSTCLMCHTVGGAGSNPTSGLHNVTPSVSGVRHDNTLPGGCAACHTIPAAGTTTHVNGTFTGNGFIAGDKTNMGLGAMYTATADNTGSCVTTTCHVGNSDDWAHKWNSTANFYTTNTTACAGCHGDWTNTWNTGVIHRTSANASSTHGGAGTWQCKDCHALEATAGTYTFAFGTNDWGGTSKHGNSTIEVNSNGTTYNTTSGLCTACHSTADGLHNFLDTSWTIASLAGDAVVISCTSCHGGASPKAGVSSTSPHVIRGNKAGYNTFNACTDCHPGGGVGSQHSATGVVGIANNTTVGINYVNGVNGYTGFNGVVLGGDATTGATEAAICWNCHNNMTYQATAISEWGTNTKQAGSPNPTQYNYGSVTTPDWTTATWSSYRTQFAYKTGAIQSTHTANPAVTDANLTGAAYGYTETKNAVADIRCSYCHDVHDNAASRGLAGDVSGKPFLRGTWWSNPYEEDGAPRSSYANTTYFPNTNTWGQVPRGSVNQNNLGGYYIDQNNVQPGTATTAANGTAAKNPTTGWTLAGSAGLCTKCHGTTVDSMDQKSDTGGLWIGTNGHANSAIGGTGSSSANSSNIFDARGGTGATYSHNPSMHYNLMDQPANNGSYGFRSNNSSGLKYQPQINAGSTRPLKWSVDEWVVDETGATKANQYHKFSCSKCHNPHASRLPKLMITNCLDTKHNTWDNQFQLNTSSGSNNSNREIANWTSAQNCHRYGALPNTGDTTEYRAGSAAGLGAGWNKVTPWTKSTPTTP